MHLRIYNLYFRSPETGDGAAAAGAGDQAIVDAAQAAVEVAAAPAAAEGAAAEPAAPDGPAKTLLSEAVEKVAEKADAKPEGDAAKPDGEPAADAKADDAAKVDGEKPEGEPDKDAKKDGEEGKPEGEKPAVEPIKAELLTIPEGITLEPAKVTEFVDVLNNADLAPQERAQKLTDLYLAEMTRLQEQTTKHQLDVWKGLNDSWKDEFRKDPDLGGAREQTTLQTAAHLVNLFGGKYRDGVLHLMNVSGAGNHRDMLGFLTNIGKALNVFEDGLIVPPSQKAGKREFGSGWYGSAQNGG